MTAVLVSLLAMLRGACDHVTSLCGAQTQRCSRTAGAAEESTNLGRRDTRSREWFSETVDVAGRLRASFAIATCARQPCGCQEGRDSPRPFATSRHGAQPVPDCGSDGSAFGTRAARA